MQREPSVIQNDFRSILKNELEMRCQQNSRYSLRAFARDLELAPSRLSEILSKKQGLSSKAASKIANKLGFTKEEHDMFCALAASQHARSLKERIEAIAHIASQQKPDDNLNYLNIDSFRIISDWYHLAITVGVEALDWAQKDTKWIANKLGLAEIQVELAIERLIRVGLLKRENGILVAKEGPGEIKGGFPSEVIKKAHTQLLDRAKDALAIQPVENREFGSAIYAIDKSRVKEMKEELEKFRHKFCSDLVKHTGKNGLYCFSMQFFSLERN